MNNAMLPGMENLVAREKLTRPQRILLDAIKANPGEDRWSAMLKDACEWPWGGIGRTADALVRRELVEDREGSLYVVPREGKHSVRG